MAVPRVFISSTYYDLKEVRNNIGNFVLNMGYEPVMHEKSRVAYVQDKPLEEDCYHELASCDIAICVIGSKFGSQSSNNDLSITMNEIQTAIKHKKKVYIFIARDMFIENRTYEQNKGSGIFKSAYTDDLRVHDFILDLRNNVKVHVISQFDTTDDIVSTLKSQFAGLFQNLLAREASLSDTKASYDLAQSSDAIKNIIEELKTEKEEFFRRFECSLFACTFTIQVLRKLLGIDKITIFIRDDAGLDEFMALLGFDSVDVDDPFEDHRKYVRSGESTDEVLTIKEVLFAQDGKLRDIRNRKLVEDSIILQVLENDDCQLPF